MKKKGFSAEQIIGKLREAEVLLSQRSAPFCCLINNSRWQVIPSPQPQILVNPLPHRTMISTTLAFSWGVYPRWGSV